MQRFIFYVSPTHIGEEIQTDCFYKLKTPFNPDVPVGRELMLLLPDDDPLKKKVKEDGEALKSMDLRKRFALSEGPYMVCIDDDDVEFTADHLIALLNEKNRRGGLKEWLQTCKV